MAEEESDAGVIAVLMERFEKQRLPRLLSIKEKVDRGEKFDDFDIAFLEEVFADASKIKPLIDKHPDYQELATRVISLHKEITSKALENEKSS